MLLLITWTARFRLKSKEIAMKIISCLSFLFFLLASCQSEDDKYTANSIAYNLFQASDFNYTGQVHVRELIDGNVEITVRLTGPSSNDAYFFPAHLHFGAYDKPDAEIAYLLKPIDIRSLESKTILGKLSDGTDLNFSAFKNFDGHLKIHLADDGPDYSVILATGNIGINENRIESFSRDKISICTTNFPN
jgi:hypothetical protein